MNAALLDINDCNLRLWGEDTPAPSPGYALLQGRDYQFGASARASARLTPRKLNTRYWWQLNTEPLQPPLGPARHTADLVHGHLLALHTSAGSPGELVLAAPASMTREQLSLLLGIAQQCPFEAVGLVNRSALLGSAYAAASPCYHLEMQLHQAVMCALECSDGHVYAARHQVLPGCGLLQLQERIVEVVATQFIRQTRFDPRRQAASEQILYDALPQLLRALAQTPETHVEIQGYRARLGADDLAACGDRLLAASATALGSSGAAATVLVEPLLTLLPGLREGLPGLIAVDGDACRQAATAHGERLVSRGQGLHLIDRLPLLNTPAPISAPDPGPSPAVAETATEAPASRGEIDSGPTHLLRGGTATPLHPDGTPIGQEGVIYRRDGKWLIRSPAPVQVNGVNWRLGQALASGDTLVTHDGATLGLIHVVAAGG